MSDEILSWEVRVTIFRQGQTPTEITFSKREVDKMGETSNILEELVDAIHTAERIQRLAEGLR